MNEIRSDVGVGSLAGRSWEDAEYLSRFSTRLCLRPIIPPHIVADIRGSDLAEM